MNRLPLAPVAAPSADSCAAEIEYTEPTPVRAPLALPLHRYEGIRVCRGGTWVGGHWGWRGGSWAWAGGRCVRPRTGYIWVAPRYEGGVYYRGHWGHGPGGPYSPGGAYVPPPAPAYR